VLSVFGVGERRKKKGKEEMPLPSPKSVKEGKALAVSFATNSKKVRRSLTSRRQNGKRISCSPIKGPEEMQGVVESDAKRHFFALR